MEEVSENAFLDLFQEVSGLFVQTLGGVLGRRSQRAFSDFSPRIGPEGLRCSKTWRMGSQPPCKLVEKIQQPGAVLCNEEGSNWRAQA